MRKATPPKGKKLNAKEAARNNFMRWVEFAEMMEENDPEW